MKYIRKYLHYSIMLMIFAGIRISPYSLGSAVLDNSINDIAIGAFASVLVALLIAIRDDWIREQDNTIILIRLLFPFYSALARYIQLYCVLCGLVEADLKNKIGTFKEWYEKYSELVGSGKNDYSDKASIKEHIDMIRRTSEAIEESQIILLKLEIVEKEVIDEIRTISNKLFLLDFMYEADNICFVHNLT